MAATSMINASAIAELPINFSNVPICIFASFNFDDPKSTESSCAELGMQKVNIRQMCHNFVAERDILATKNVSFVVPDKKFV